MIRAVNLIPDHRFEARRQRRRVGRWGVGCGVYGLALIGLWALVQSLGGGADTAIARDLSDAEAQLADTAATIERMQPVLVRAEASLFASRSIGNQPNWSILLDLLAGLLDDQTLLTGVELKPIASMQIGAPPVGYTLSIAGMAQTHAAANAYVLRLEETDLFDRVEIQGANKQSFGSGSAVAFRVTCRLAEGRTSAAEKPS